MIFGSTGVPPVVSGVSPETRMTRIFFLQTIILQLHRHFSPSAIRRDAELSTRDACTLPKSIADPVHEFLIGYFLRAVKIRRLKLLSRRTFSNAPRPRANEFRFRRLMMSVGQASRLSQTSKEIPNENRDRRDACPTANFVRQASFSVVVKSTLKVFKSRLFTPMSTGIDFQRAF